MKLIYINGEFTRGNSQEEIEVTNPAGDRFCPEGKCRGCGISHTVE